LRTITIVKAGDLTKGRIKGAVSPLEILSPPGQAFLEADPPEGFSVRNFHIQTAKLAAVSDIIVYGEEDVMNTDVFTLAINIATAQRDWLKKNEPGQESPVFNTFMLSSQ